MQKYLSEVLLIQIVATLLVVAGHSYPFVTAIPGWVDSIRIFLYAFHMPLFVWISGYLLTYTSQARKYKFKKFCGRRFLKLLIPYFLLSAIAILPKYATQSYLNDSLNLDAYSLVRAFLVPRENIWGHFWFLPMIYIQGIIGFCLDKVFDRFNCIKIGWTVTTIVLFVVYVPFYKTDLCAWLSVNDLMSFSWLFSLGALCGSYNVIGCIKPNKGLLYFSVAFILAVVVFLTNFLINLRAIQSAVIALLMILGLVSLCVCLSQKINLDRTKPYAQTFTIFLLSWPCQAVINVLVERLFHWPFYLIMPIQFIGGLFGPIIINLIILRLEKRFNFHWISFSLGK